jgi:hypothetical protein
MKWRILASLVLVVGVMLGMSATVFADDHAHITITATPLYLCITNSPNTWTMNDLVNHKAVHTDTVYYSNPLGDTTAPPSTVNDSSCRFTVTCCVNATTVDLTVNVGNFSGGDFDMTNSNDGSNGATTFDAYSWYSGMTYSGKVIAKDTGSTAMYTTGLAASSTLKWGMEIETRTDAATGGNPSTATATITATEH